MELFLQIHCLFSLYVSERFLRFLSLVKISSLAEWLVYDFDP
jgi:hypothetical protein